MAENKNTGKKPGRPKKTPVAEEVKEEDVFFDVPEEDQTANTAEKAETGKENILSVNADDVTGIRYDGSEVPLTEVAPELAGKSIEVHTETSKKAEPTFTMADVQKMVADAVAKAVANVQPQTPVTPQIIQVANDSEMVHFLWEAPVADDNVVFFGEGGIFGQIVGKSGSFYVPHRDLSRVLTDVNRVFMARRWLIVVSGLSDDEREALGVNYKDGEILDKRVFARMAEYSDEMLSLYPKLCEGHKKMVAQTYAEEYALGNPNITREIVVKLNEMSKTPKNQRGDFISIIEEMNARDAQ